MGFERRGESGSVDHFLMRQFPGKYRSRRYFHWKKAYFVWAWSGIPSKQAASWKQVPNGWVRGFTGREAKLRGLCLEKMGMPKELQTAVSEKVLALTEGDRLFQRAEPVSRSQVESSVADVVRAVNEAAEASKEDVQRFNIQLAQRFVNEEISYEEFERDLKQEIRTVRAQSMRNVTAKLLRRGGFTKQAVNTAGTYLESDDPRMLASLA